MLLNTFRACKLTLLFRSVSRGLNTSNTWIITDTAVSQDGSSYIPASIQRLESRYRTLCRCPSSAVGWESVKLSSAEMASYLSLQSVPLRCSSRPSGMRESEGPCWGTETWGEGGGIGERGHDS